MVCDDKWFSGFLHSKQTRSRVVEVYTGATVKKPRTRLLVALTVFAGSPNRQGRWALRLQRCGIIQTNSCNNKRVSAFNQPSNQVRGQKSIRVRMSRDLARTVANGFNRAQRAVPNVVGKLRQTQSSQTTSGTALCAPSLPAAACLQHSVKHSQLLQVLQIANLCWHFRKVVLIQAQSCCQCQTSNGGRYACEVVLVD